MLSREEALAMVKKNISKRNIFYHMLAVEAGMRETARYLNEDEERWGLTGLLHDIDYERTEMTPEKHSLVAKEILANLIPSDVLRAIESHNCQHTKTMPESVMEKALIACDAISGLLIACALVMPSKKLIDVKVESVAKKFRDKDFARGADRDRILFCEQIGIPRDRFFTLSLEGLRKIGSEIGL